jgi:hypothetical protein
MKSKRAPRDAGVNTDPATNFLPRAPAIFATMYSRQRGADSEGWRSGFRSDVDHDSEVMPISVPN